MLVPFVIDADSLAKPDDPWDSAHMRACSNRLLDLWDKVGLLVHDGEQFTGSKLHQAISILPPKLKSLWQAMAKHRGVVSCGAGWNGELKRANAPDLCGLAQVGLVGQTAALVEFEMPDDQDETVLLGPDCNAFVVSRLLMASDASVFANALALARRNVETGEAWQDIWQARFRGLASAPIPSVKNIAVVDRFSVERHMERAPNRDSGLSGLERFLRQLALDAAGPRHVDLYSAWTTDWPEQRRTDIAREMEELLSRMPTARIRSLKLYMVRNYDFGRIAPDRYVRFGPYVWELGHGLQILEGRRAAHFYHASFKSGADSHRRTETELRTHAKPSVMEIKGRGSV